MPDRGFPSLSQFGMALGLLLTILGASPARAQFGLAVSGVGPINRSMGGAATAAPIDSAGALYWNAASIGALPSSEMEFGIGFVIPRTTISSSVPADAFGPGTPPVRLGGTNTGGNNGVFVLPVVGVVYKPEESPFAFGLGIFEIGGFGANYPITRTNPILNPQVPFGLGIGPLFTQLQLLQFSPTVSFKVTDQLYLGVAGNIDIGTLYADPALFAPPALAATPHGPLPIYPSAVQGRNRFGGGFQLGVYYIADDSWSFGASVKSPQWFEPYTYNAENPLNGNPSNPKVSLNFPLTASLGVAYRGFEKMLIASDFRYLDYRNTDGFRRGGFGPDGVLGGLGWQSIFAYALGIQYQWTDSFSTRIGYTFSMNPVGPAMTSFNVGAPTIIMNTLAIGCSYNVTQAFRISLAYAHDFQNTITGPLVEPFLGPIPGSRVRTASTADAVFMGATVTF
jgi:long-chain fatty acid transport protein